MGVSTNIPVDVAAGIDSVKVVALGTARSLSDDLCSDSSVNTCPPVDDALLSSSLVFFIVSSTSFGEESNCNCVVSIRG